MLTIFIIMVAGIAIGYVFRTKTQWAKKALMPLICLLLLLLGMEVGGNERLMQAWTTIGIDALIIALGTVLGSCVAAWGLWRMTDGRRNSLSGNDSDGERKGDRP